MNRKRRNNLIVLALVGALGALLALPAFASAAGFVVNELGDSANTANCKNEAPECSLRGAILAADETSGKDVITFAANSPFNGFEPESRIVTTSQLPPIDEEVEIDGGRCVGPVQEGPCVEVALAGNTTESAFVVEADKVTIKNLAIGGGKNGIVVKSGFESFRATGDRFGFKLDFVGSGEAIANAGILLEPESESAVIGGTTAADRDVFTHSKVGIEIRGASKTKVEGDYIGVGQTGDGFATVEDGVAIFDAAGSAAEENEVGGVLGPAEAATPACDGPCNVIANDSNSSVDLGGSEFSGSAAATGPTVIRGNYLGLAADGSSGLSLSGGSGVSAVFGSTGTSGPGEVTVGGADATTEGNLFVGAMGGVVSEGAPGLSVIGNRFGYTFSGALTEPPEFNSVAINSEGLLKGAVVTDNSINATDSELGVSSLSTGSEIRGNKIVGGVFGIFAQHADAGVGNTISANTISETGRDGIWVENDANVIKGNTVSGAGESGIEVEGEGFGPGEEAESNVVIGNAVEDATNVGIRVGSDATHNRVGGDGAGEANTIDGSGGAGATEGAIVIVSRTTGRNEIAANTGFGNSGAFIKLVSHGGPEEPNGGIKPPAFATVLQSTASGTAEAGATIRLFNKAAAEPGELGAPIAVTKADAFGNWSTTFTTKQPVGTLVTATQTSVSGGTSVLATAVGASADPSPPDTGGGTTPTPVITPPVSTPPLKKAPTKPKPLKCKKGFAKKKVKGKARCVKVKKPKKKPRQHGH